jgi:hypothetical protein
MALNEGVSLLSEKARRAFSPKLRQLSARPRKRRPRLRWRMPPVRAPRNACTLVGIRYLSVTFDPEPPSDRDH